MPSITVTQGRAAGETAGADCQNTRFCQGRCHCLLLPCILQVRNGAQFLCSCEAARALVSCEVVYVSRR